MPKFMANNLPVKASEKITLIKMKYKDIIQILESY